MATGKYRVEYDGQICVHCAQLGYHINDYCRVRCAANNTDLDGIKARTLIDQCSGLLAQHLRINRMYCMYTLVILNGQGGDDGQSMHASGADGLNVRLYAGTTTRV
jgi:hypothetical protein